MGKAVTRGDVLGFRVRAQQLDREHGIIADTAVLDIGVQDTGPDGARWALAVRGVDVTALDDAELILLWTVRGAPHVYRRADLPAVAAAVEPFSDADAGKRIYDAAKPLKAAGIGILAALDEVADRMRDIVTEPTVKGDVSGRLGELLPEPYLRSCRPCNAIHVYEMPFRLAALRAGLELRLDTSPPVLQRITGFRAANTPGDRFDLIRAYLRLLGPATPQHVAAYLDEILVSLQPLLRRSPHRLVVDVPAGLTVTTQPGALYQILVNLVTNSLSHGFTGERAGTMRESAHAEGEGWVLEYADDGVGMDEAVRRRLYDPFFTTRRGQGGSGLGMHIVYNLVQALGGTIECSSGPGQGTRFTLRMPRRQPAAQSG